MLDDLSSWGTQGIDLTLTASSPMDPHRRSPKLDSGLSRERWAFEDNHLNLDDAVSLSRLPCIEALTIPNGRRMLHPSAIGKIISSLPRLERLTLKLNSPRTKRVEMQNEHRLCKIDMPLTNLRCLLTVKRPCKGIGVAIIK